MSAEAADSEPVHPSRRWIVASGILSVLVGLLALVAPVFFSQIFTQVVGAFLVVSGVAGLVVGIFGKHNSHRFFSLVTGLIRLGAGWMLFFNTASGLEALTVVLATVFILEGILCSVAAFGLRNNPAWIWILLNAIAAFLLGGMIYAGWPDDSAWTVGLLYGLQALVAGAALLTYGLARERRTAPV